LFLSFLALAFAADPTLQEFNDWMKSNNKVYLNDVEYMYRYKIYLDSKEIVADLNNNTYDVVFELNKFADWTQEEFSRKLLGSKPSDVQVDPLDNAPLDSAPAAHDWCMLGKCTPIKNQEQCGSCWAFATTENIESVHAIAGLGLPILAPQQIVDCDTAEDGCNGGNPAQAYMYVKNAGGLDTESSYPYVGFQGACRFRQDTVGGKITGEKNGYGGSEDNMAANLAAEAPFSVLVDAQTWQFYRSGIMKQNQCGKDLDHAVVAVGYSMPSKFWRVRNSWGADWGENGFIRLEFGTNTCGIRSQVLTSIAEK